MTINEAIRLIGPFADQAYKRQQKWADLGCGNGLFSLALARLLPTSSRVIGIDRKEGSFKEKVTNGVTLEFMQADFTQMNWDEVFDGFLLANSLHYVQDRPGLLRKLKKSLADNGQIVIVEYDTKRSNQWVPYPISYPEVVELSEKLGFASCKKLGERESIFGPEKMYACELKP